MILKKYSPLEYAEELSYPPKEWMEYEEAFLYHENSKFGRRKSQKDFVHIGQLRANKNLVSAMTRQWKVYPHVEYKPLPSVVDFLAEPGMSLEEAIVRRRSSRCFSGKAISWKAFARMLVLSYGITGEMPYDTSDIQYLRASPSAGALYPLEIYPVVFHVEELEMGVYHYNVRDNALGLLKEGDFREELFALCTEQDMVRDAGGVFLITAQPLRTMRKYRERGLRFIYLDAGHLAQNMYLLAVSSGCGACALGGLYDWEVEDFLGIDGFYETVIYAVVVGAIE